jgi:hypothetical protein
VELYPGLAWALNRPVSKFIGSTLNSQHRAEHIDKAQTQLVAIFAAVFGAVFGAAKQALQIPCN